MVHDWRWALEPYLGLTPVVTSGVVFVSDRKRKLGRGPSHGSCSSRSTESVLPYTYQDASEEEGVPTSVSTVGCGTNHRRPPQLLSRDPVSLTRTFHWDRGVRSD